MAPLPRLTATPSALMPRATTWTGYPTSGLAPVPFSMAGFGDQLGADIYLSPLLVASHHSAAGAAAAHHST